MAPSEYVAMDPDELEDKLAESRKELFNLRFQKATGQLDNTARLGHVKKEVARILTELRRQDVDVDEEVWQSAAAATGRRHSDEDVEDGDGDHDVEDEEEA